MGSELAPVMALRAARRLLGEFHVAAYTEARQVPEGYRVLESREVGDRHLFLAVKSARIPAPGFGKLFDAAEAVADAWMVSALVASVMREASQGRMRRNRWKGSSNRP